jgi:outer membrane protein
VLTAEAKTKAEGEAQKKLEEIQRKQGAVQDFTTKTRNSLQQRMKNLRDVLLEEITKVVNDIAKRKGATLALDKSGPTLFGIPGVLYADSSYEITDEVLKEINKDRPAAAPAAAVTPAPAAGTTPATPAPAFNVPNVGGKTEPKKP